MDLNSKPAALGHEAKNINKRAPYTYRLIPPKITSSSSIATSYFCLHCNFHELSKKYPEFRHAWDELKNRQRQQQRQQQQHHSFNASLTKSLLHHHFGISMPSLPPGRLCPPVPNRANYVCWIRQLIKEQVQECKEEAESFGATCRKNSTINHQGIDIGTGVSAIYPLLLSSELFSKSEEFCELDGCGGQEHGASEGNTWKFLATDVDPVAVASASMNVEANQLKDQIEVIQVAELTETSHSHEGTKVADGRGSKISPEFPKGPLFTAMEESKKVTMFRKPNLRGANENIPANLANYPKFDFVMTNPPFYSTLKEATDFRAGDGRSRTDMSANECVYRPDMRAFDINLGGASIEIEEDIEGVSSEGIGNNSKCKTVEEPGGDVGFVTAIMNDSQFFRHHITWYSSLVAKRSSLTLILQRLQALEGVWGNRGQVRMVEFRQGNGEDTMDDSDRKNSYNPRSRWGVAWTYERAVGRCRACRVRGGLQSFDVWISSREFQVDNSVDLTSDMIKQSFDGDLIDQKNSNTHDNIQKACKEITNRLTSYYESHAMKCVSQMRNRSSFDIDGQERKSVKSHKDSLCITATEAPLQNYIGSDSQQSDLNHNYNLPIEGHFLIDTFVECHGEPANGNMRVQVNLEMYCHTKHGQNVLDKIRGQMPGEVGRTNRRWRRILKKAPHQSAT
ncbi:hypothetical protein ACHAXS_009640 [Conticribra weissflogii]